MWTEFKTFITRGNVVDLAIGVVIGASFGGIVSSAVNDVLMPPLGVVLGNIDFRDLYVILKEGTPPSPYANLEAAGKAGAVALRIGMFLNATINFLIVAATMFCVIKAVNRVMPKPAPVVCTKDCTFCKMQIPLAATRCPHCTSVFS